MMNKVTDLHLVEINKLISEKENQPSGVLDMEALTGIVAEVYRIAPRDGTYIYRSIVDKAVKYGTMLAASRAFQSCNMKTAVVAVITVLALNNVKLSNYEGGIQTLAGYLKEGDGISSRNWILDHSHNRTKSKEAQYWNNA